MSRLITLRNTIPVRERKGGSLSTFLVPSGASFNRPLTSLIQGAPQWHRWASWDREVAFIFRNNMLMLITSNTIVLYKPALVIEERKKVYHKALHNCQNNNVSMWENTKKLKTNLKKAFTKLLLNCSNVIDSTHLGLWVGWNKCLEQLQFDLGFLTAPKQTLKCSYHWFCVSCLNVSPRQTPTEMSVKILLSRSLHVR